MWLLSEELPSSALVLSVEEEDDEDLEPLAPFVELGGGGGKVTTTWLAPLT
jgi:hypothetical protein